MKLNELRKVIREEVKAAIQEELKDILLEAVRSPKTVVTGNSPIQSQPQSLPETDKAKLRENMMGVLDGMKPGQDTLSFNSTLSSRIWRKFTSPTRDEYIRRRC